MAARAKNPQLPKWLLLLAATDGQQELYHWPKSHQLAEIGKAEKLVCCVERPVSAHSVVVIWEAVNIALLELLVRGDSFSKDVTGTLLPLNKR